MADLTQISRWLVMIGLTITVLGGILWILSRIPGIDKFPGTLQIETGNLSCTFPLLLSVVLSIGLTLVLNIITRLMNR